MKKLIVFSMIIFSLILCGCSEKKLFKETKIDLIQAQQLPVKGFGSGSSKSPNLAKMKAKNNALSNLAMQLSGTDFSFQKINQSVSFETSTRSTLSGVREVSSDYIGDNTYLSVLTAELPEKTFTAYYAWLLETEYRSNNLEKSIHEKYQQAVKQIFDQHFKNNTRLEGKIFLTNINVQFLEKIQEFSVKLQILLLIK